MVIFPITTSGKVKKSPKKKKKNFFSAFGSFLPFLVVSFPEKMIRKCFGGKEKE